MVFIMCGIFGFEGKFNAEPILVEGLRRLEYRGYDSWGVAYKKEGESNLTLKKETGRIIADVNTSEAATSENYMGIAHTRWATHGGVTGLNAHPHLSADGTFAIAQNGIAENYQDLKHDLITKGHQFVSETDTEVILRQIEENLKTGSDDLFSAFIQTFKQLKGRNTVILFDSKNEQIFAIRNGSPLVVGKQGENIFIGSDYLSFANHTNTILELNNLQGVKLHKGQLEKFSVAGPELEILPLEFIEVEVTEQDIDKGIYSDYMLKEITEQPQTVINATLSTEADLMPLVTAIKASQTVYVVGCGTAGFAAGQISFYLRKLAGVKAIELKGYELDSYRDLFTKEDLLIAISQSGETTDTIEAVEFMKSKGGKVASVVNMLGSTLTRISDLPFFSRTGPEICVASTKAFTAQISWGFMLAEALQGNYAQAKAEMQKTSEAIAMQLEDQELLKNIQEVVNYCAGKEHAYVLGRGQNFYIALEGALKVKEITYKHFEGFAAGELKHGVIALVEQGTPIIAIISKDEVEADMLSAVAEVRARGGKIIAVASEPNELFDYYLPVKDLASTSAITNVVPFQLISYHLGKKLGNNVDRPRNLAKSVTVK